MSRNPDNESSNPISRAFSKFFERGDVSKNKTVKAETTTRPAVRPTQTAQPRAAQSPRAQAMNSPLTGAAGTTRAAPPAPAATAQTGTVAPTPAAAAKPRTHTVQQGESLSKIAQQVYGRADRWKLIFEANRDKISDPDLIHPGQVLVIPDAKSLH
ncbi:LysM peptidoglycan-binding domain-containing protein [Lysobacter korlensis]|uniref:LysM peptidoglycan-binding domain-containing protein n=1 Tax=Lysobacter korlensis TaxID=553636 RepID=A0ABV6RL99_9GAMM